MSRRRRRRSRGARQRGGVNVDKYLKKARKAITGRTANRILNYGEIGLKQARRLQKLLEESQIGAGAYRIGGAQRGGFLPGLLGMGLLPLAGNAINKLIDKI